MSQQPQTTFLFYQDFFCLFGGNPVLWRDTDNGTRRFGHREIGTKPIFWFLGAIVD